MAVNFKKFVKEEWQVEHADACPIFAEMSGYHFTQKYVKKIPAYKRIVCYYKDDQADWMTDPDEQKAVGKIIVDIFLYNPKIIIEEYKKWHKLFNRLETFYHCKYNDDLKTLNNKELINWIKEVYKFYRDKIYFPSFIDGFMFYADKRLNDIVENYCKENNIGSYNKILSILSAPVNPSFINEEERDLQKIALDYEKHDNQAAKRIKNHLFKYSWIKSSYAGFKEYKLKDVLKEIDRIRQNKKNALIKIFETNKENKKKILKKYIFTPEIVAISSLSEIFVKWQDQRKIYTLTFVTLQEKILREISRRAGVDLKLLRYCRISELPGILILKRKFNKKELVNRQKSSLFIYEKGRIANIFVGKKAEKFFREACGIKIKEAKEIKGITASLGKVRGVAKVVKTAKYINKIKEGDILVAPMTRPEYLAGVKKASAIITDDGGITCHAAIISRELGIPCIIGTKIATKILKDGDLVEVDANKGIVKVLKRK